MVDASGDMTLKPLDNQPNCQVLADDACPPGPSYAMAFTVTMHEWMGMSAFRRFTSVSAPPAHVSSCGTKQYCGCRSSAWPQAEVLRTRIEGLRSPRARRPLVYVDVLRRSMPMW